MSLTYSTHTQVNSQSQIRWQIRRLMLLGGCGIGDPPLLQAVPQNIHATSHTRHSGLKAEKQAYKRRLLFYTKKPPPIEVPAFSFTPSLFFDPSLSHSISPPSLSSLTANQVRDDIIMLQPVRRQFYESVCVCVGGGR